MKKILIIAIIAVIMGFNTIAYAAEEVQKVDAGITPDSILYSADKLIEDLQLLFTLDNQKEAELLLQFANERLSEAKEMTEEEKTEFVEAAVKDYTAIMDKAEEKITEVAANESTTNEVKEELAQELENTAVVDDSIQSELGTEQQVQLEEKTAEVSYTANVVKNLDASVVQALREKGMGFGQIAHTIALSELSGKTVDEIAALLEEGQGIGEIAKGLGIHPSKINDKTEDVTNEDTKVETAAVIDENTSDESKVEAVTDTAQVSETINQTATAKVKNNDIKAAVQIKDKSKSEKVTVTNDTTIIQQEGAAVDMESNKNEIKNDENKSNNKSDRSSKGKK